MSWLALLHNYMFCRLNAKTVWFASDILKFIDQSILYSNISNSSLKMIPDFKQQISELEKQKQDLEIRLNEQTEKMKGN